MFPHLFSEIQVGSRNFRNRIVSSANFTGLAENHFPSERFADYHAEKAKGGVALTVVEELPISPSTRFALPRSIFAYDRGCLPGFKLMTTKVHSYGALTCAQLIHRGAHQYGFDPSGLVVKVAGAASQIPSLVAPDGYSVPYEMTTNEIEKEADNYASTASILLEAGFDGIEIKCDASSLPIQFLSPLTNKRKDEYGGNFDNRIKFLDLVVSKIYEVTNGKSLLGIKMPGDEFVNGGLTIADTQRISQKLDASGKVDYIAIGGGNLGFDPDYNTPSAYYPQGLFVKLAETVRKGGLKMKVITLGRIVEPSFADSIIAEGKADLVIMMRALIADPELPRKAKEGRISDIIPCIGCNQGCLGHVLQDRSTSCILNPVIGREKEWGAGSLTKTGRPKNILIIGAGPSGIECARVCALQGHKVTIIEKSESIGGQAKLASSLPGRTDLSKAITFWENELKKLNVETIFGVNANASDIVKLNPDVVVCATGSDMRSDGFSPAFPSPAGIEHIQPLEDLLALKQGERKGTRTVLYDDRGDFQALGWTELSAMSASMTTLVTRNPMVGMYVDGWTRMTAYKRLYKLGVNFFCDSFPKEITQNSMTCFSVYNRDKTTVLESDFSYFISWPISKSSLFEEISSQKPNVRVVSIGDYKAPRSLEEAIFEGHELGRKL